MISSKNHLPSSSLSIRTRGKKKRKKYFQFGYCRLFLFSQTLFRGGDWKEKEWSQSEVFVWRLCLWRLTVGGKRFDLCCLLFLITFLLALCDLWWIHFDGIFDVLYSSLLFLLVVQGCNTRNEKISFLRTSFPFGIKAKVFHHFDASRFSLYGAISKAFHPVGGLHQIIPWRIKLLPNWHQKLRPEKERKSLLLSFSVFWRDVRRNVRYLLRCANPKLIGINFSSFPFLFFFSLCFFLSLSENLEQNRMLSILNDSEKHRPCMLNPEDVRHR